MKRGTVFNIQKFSVNDGPGIRTTVFMKGCPLNCVWCHNPESKSFKHEIFYNEKKCIGCQKCKNVCEFKCHSFIDGLHLYDRKNCIACGKCAEVCVSEALETVGYDKSVDEVIKEVIKDKIFYDNSGGGITLSGGEPMYQFEFTYELLKEAKKNNIHTCIETCGFSSEENYRAIADYTDIFLFDCKETNPIKHKKFTGVSNELILKNLMMLDKLGCKIIIRCPIIPGLNDTKEHFDNIAKTANELNNILEINIEPYHPLGKGKAEMLGKKYFLNNLSFPDDKTVEEWIQNISSKTNTPVRKA